jgi:hypothetical protein
MQYILKTSGQTSCPTALLLLGEAGVAEGGSSGNLTPATLVRYQRVGAIIWQRYTNFKQIRELSPNSWLHMGDTKQVQYRGPTDIRRQRTKGHPGFMYPL